jgi:hypothetical protein
MNESDEPYPTTQPGWYQVIKGYIPNQWSITQAKFFSRPRTRHKIQYMRTMDEPTYYYILLDARPYPLAPVKSNGVSSTN